MHTKTMEGLVGASTNMDLLHTPFRVYKEARQKGDAGAMKRAMGYVNEYSDKAEEYMEKAEKGMKEDAEEAREKVKAEHENALKKRREEREELENRIEEGRMKHTDTVEISEDGKEAWSENTGVDSDGMDNHVPAETAADAVKSKPVIYTKDGSVSQSQKESVAKLSVSV